MCTYAYYAALPRSDARGRLDSTRHQAQGAALDSSLLNELRSFAMKTDAEGAMPSDFEISEYLHHFHDRFGPQVLHSSDGASLLNLMHGRHDEQSRCLAYWLEFKDDPEFRNYAFGGIGGGSSLKFGIYQRQRDGAWVIGGPRTQEVISPRAAQKLARAQRDELLAGVQVLASIEPRATTDYFDVQARMEQAAPRLCRTAWAHKYWFLCQPEVIDPIHSPGLQRFHLLKLLQTPPDRTGVRDSGAGRFVCAGEFVRLARSLGISMVQLGRVLNLRHGALHAYWKIGTTEGSSGESQWPQMRDDGFVSIGWLDTLPDLSWLTAMEDVTDARSRVRHAMRDAYADERTASRKAGEVINFVREVVRGDIVLAVDGQHVLGIGRVEGHYQYDPSRRFPHLRPVSWLHLDPWWLPESEGPRTTVYQLGRNARNLLAIEEQLAQAAIPPLPPYNPQPLVRPAPAPAPLPPLDPTTARIEAALRRKGQVILYGPPGTGKTHHALTAVRELASRERHGMPWRGLSAGQQRQLEGPEGPIQKCSFHPGWGYEDFVEGMRPALINSQMAFQRRDGVFKQICLRAAEDSHRHFLLVDEINRGDLPRIFGELLTSLELDKRQVDIVLPLSGETLRIPPNLRLIGTMNTADRSIALLDAALRRRFGFIELMPDSKVLGHRLVSGLPLGPWLDALNERIRRGLQRDARHLQVGHAYLMPTQPIQSMADFACVLREEIVPLLEEYCYDDMAALERILGDGLVDKSQGRIREELFQPEREVDLLQAVRFEELSDLALGESLPDEDADSTDEDMSSDNGYADHA